MKVCQLHLVADDSEEVVGSIPKDVTRLSNNYIENEPVRAEIVEQESKSNEDVDDDDQAEESEEQQYKYVVDVNVLAAHEPEKVETLKHTFVVRKYIRKHLISEETISETEFDSGNEEYIGESNSN